MKGPIRSQAPKSPLMKNCAPSLVKNLAPLAVMCGKAAKDWENSSGRLSSNGRHMVDVNVYASEMFSDG